VPALVMGAASVNLPSIVISGGAMLNSLADLGSGTDVWRFSERCPRPDSLELHGSADRHEPIGRCLQREAPASGDDVEALS
jgi:hypothetical protein